MAVLMHALLVAGGLLPVAALLSALSAAIWIREGQSANSRAPASPRRAGPDG